MVKSVYTLIYMTIYSTSFSLKTCLLNLSSKIKTHNAPADVKLSNLTTVSQYAHQNVLVGKILIILLHIS
jgi:hypothetical protein